MVHIHTYARTPLAETTLIFLVPAVCVQTIRRLMIDMILGTDMKLHMNHVKTFQTYLGRSIATVCRGTEREREAQTCISTSPPPSLSISCDSAHLLLLHLFRFGQMEDYEHMDVPSDVLSIECV